MKSLILVYLLIDLTWAQTTCIFTTWSNWTDCGMDCMQSRTRTLQIGDPSYCESQYGPLTNQQVCEDGLCGQTTTTAPPIGSTRAIQVVTTTTTMSSSPVQGCRINGVDPGTKPSSLGFKAVGAQGDCGQRCQLETSFTCEGFITTGPNGPCLLLGPLDRNISLMKYSRYYLQDLQCATEHGTIKTCQYERTGTIRTPDDSYYKDFKGIGFAINAEQCQHLCQMNFPMFQQNSCSLFAFDPTKGFQSSGDNCYFFNSAITSNLTGTGLDLYEIVCK